MTATLFVTQLQLMRKNMPPEALTGPFAQQQKMMLYLFPLIFAVGGINFPVGVLIYWFTSNLWTMGQQFYVIRRNPAPGTPAYDAWEHRHLAKKTELKLAGIREPEPVEEVAVPAPQGRPATAAKANAIATQVTRTIPAPRLDTAPSAERTRCIAARDETGMWQPGPMSPQGGCS